MKIDGDFICWKCDGNLYKEESSEIQDRINLFSPTEGIPAAAGLPAKNDNMGVSPSVIKTIISTPTKGPSPVAGLPSEKNNNDINLTVETCDFHWVVSRYPSWRSMTCAPYGNHTLFVINTIVTM